MIYFYCKDCGINFHAPERVFCPVCRVKSNHESTQAGEKDSERECIGNEREVLHEEKITSDRSLHRVAFFIDTPMCAGDVVQIIRVKSDKTNEQKE